MTKMQLYPRRAAAIARPAPVLPEVGATIVPPGRRRPSCSAASTIARPMRSFTEPPGFRYSSLASSSPGTSRPRRSRRTIGVRPTSSSTVGNARRAIGRQAYFPKRRTPDPISPVACNPVASYAEAGTLEAGLPDIFAAPSDLGTVELVVRRPTVGEREVLDEGVLDIDEGLVGDRWLPAVGGTHEAGDDGKSAQITLMSARVIGLVAGNRKRWPLA